MALSESVISRLRNQHTIVPDLTKGLTKAQLEQYLVPGKWSALEQIAHLAAYQPIYISRLAKMSRGEEPLFERYVAGDDPHFHECKSWSVEQLIQSLQQNGKLIADTLTAYEAPTLELNGRHPIYGLLDIAEWTEFYLLHEAHHLFQVFMLTKSVHL